MEIRIRRVSSEGVRLWYARKIQLHHTTASTLEVSCPSIALRCEEVSTYVEMGHEKHSEK